MIVPELRLRGLEQLARALKSLHKAISTESVQKVGRSIGGEALRTLRQLTPRQNNENRWEGSRRGHPPFAEQWDLAESTSPGHYRGRVYSKASRSHSGFVALASLEFGAKPHDILPSDGKRLAWNQSSRVFSPERTSKGGQLRAGFGGGRVSDGRDILDLIGRRDGGSTVLPEGMGVRHPGHEGFHMVEKTAELTKAAVDVALAQYADAVQAAFQGGLTPSAGFQFQYSVPEP